MERSLISMITLFVRLLVGGFTLKILWNWFIANTFNINVLALYQAIGVYLVVMYFRTTQPTYKQIKEAHSTSEDKIFDSMLFIAYCAVVLLVGWLIHIIL